MLEDHLLSPAVQHVCASFALVDGQPQLVRRAFRHAMAEMRGLPASEREFVLAELVALAVKFQELGGAATHKAVAQLLLLGGGVLHDMSAARRLFESQGVHLDDAAKFLARDVPKRPAPRGRATGKNSLLALRAGRNAPDEEETDG